MGCCRNNNILGFWLWSRVLKEVKVLHDRFLGYNILHSIHDIVYRSVCFTNIDLKNFVRRAEREADLEATKFVEDPRAYIKA